MIRLDRFQRHPSFAPLSISIVLALAALAPTPSRAGVPLGVVAAAASGQSNYGTIKGRLVWGGDEAPGQKILVAKGQAPKDPALCAAAAPIPDQSLLIDPKTKGIKYGFAYLVKPTGANPDAVKALVAKTASVSVDNKNCEFLPFATAVHQDQPLVFNNSDPVNHNVHLSAFTNDAFNILLPPNGSTTKSLVAEKRPLQLTCDIHPWMKGYLMVFDHPFFAVTGADGSFQIAGVPEGEQNLVVWQSTVGFVSAGLAKGVPVKVSAGEVTDAGEFKLDPAKVK